jgi:small-conductance mechanosensitive channel
VGTLVVAIVLLGAGVRVARRIGATLGRVLVRRFQVEAGAAEAISTLCFYGLFVAFAVSALRIVHFPMTAFTVVGGALAIGVGFGSQNIVNNFISGLILMLERPIRPGDFVEVEGTHGIVERIGARSTRIQASNNTHMIVPNSFFLENHVVNYTLSDDTLRTEVRVGVAYGSPVRDVERLLLESVSGVAGVLDTRPPDVIFADFGNDALVFDLVFWVHARTNTERRRIESAARFRIDELFRAHGIVIAFPQRDVHFDFGRPLELRMVRDGESST